MEIADKLLEWVRGQQTEIKALVTTVLLLVFALLVYAIWTPRRGIASSGSQVDRVPVSVASASSASGSDLSVETGISFEDYHVGLAHLQGRFAEAEAYAEQLVGKGVQWEGVVVNVSSTKLPVAGVLVMLQGENKEYFGAAFPESLRTRAFALVPGDRVRVKGIVRRTGGLTVHLDGKALELVGSANKNAPR